MATLDIMAEIFEIRFGNRVVGNEKRTELLAELLAFRRVLAESGRRSVTPAAIRNWVLPKGIPPTTSTLRRKDALEFAYAYLDWAVEHKKVHGKYTSKSKKISAHIESLLGVRQVTNFDSNIPFDQADELFLKDQTIMAAVRAIVYASSRNTRSERNDLFIGGTSTTEDKSYYLLYRFSTRDEIIVKSLIQINTPTDRSDTYSFNHFICFKLEDSVASGSKQNIYRECEGVICKFDTSYYFIGSNFGVSIDKAAHPARYQQLRNYKRERPSGIGIITVEYDSIRQNSGLLSGLTMTLAGNDQPVIARVALLHLGVQSSIGRRINDEIVKPGGLTSNEVEADMKELFVRLRKHGVKRLSELLENVIIEDQDTGEGSRRLSLQILALIDNTPAYEKARAGVLATMARGAIETIGSPGRPRD